MEKTALSLYHGGKDKGRPPVTFYFPEPGIADKVHLQRKGDTGKGWQTALLGATGIGWLFSYRQYTIEKAATFVAEPSEPVICLRVHVGDGASLGYGEAGENVPLDFRDNRIFWQGGRSTEYRLMPGEHTLVELYVRPECLSNLVHMPVVAEMIAVSRTESSGNMEQFIFSDSEALDAFLWAFLEELDTRTPTAERFHYLCECLVLMALGEAVDVLPPDDSFPETSTGENVHTSDPKSTKTYDFPPAQQEALQSLEGLDRKQLLRKFRSLHKKAKKLESLLKLDKELASAVDKVAGPIRQVHKERLADAYMDTAKFLAVAHGKQDLTTNQLTLVKRAVIRSCKRAFENRMPNLSEAQFYSEWSDRPYVSQPLGMDVFSDILSMLLPSGSPDFTGLDTDPKGRLLLDEKIREALGFGHMSDFTGETADDKPAEVVTLYKYLMERLSETLDFREDEGLERSDTVRMLDNAYEHNDLLGLIQVEVSQLADIPGYAEQQDDWKLRWFILALGEDIDYFREMLDELGESPAYADLRLFKKLGKDIRKLRKVLASGKDVCALRSDWLAGELASVSAGPTVDGIVNLAKHILTPKR